MNESRCECCGIEISAGKKICPRCEKHSNREEMTYINGMLRKASANMQNAIKRNATSEEIANLRRKQRILKKVLYILKANPTKEVNEND